MPNSAANAVPLFDFEEEPTLDETQPEHVPHRKVRSTLSPQQSQQLCAGLSSLREKLKKKFEEV